MYAKVYTFSEIQMEPRIQLPYNLTYILQMNSLNFELLDKISLHIMI